LLKLEELRHLISLPSDDMPLDTPKNFWEGLAGLAVVTKNWVMGILNNGYSNQTTTDSLTKIKH
jgi:hypothetical protein